jgi:hypothetical protein
MGCNHSLHVVAITLALSSLAAAQEPWAVPECRYRTQLTAPGPVRDSAPRVVECALDVPLLLKEGGVQGVFDPASLRLVQGGTAIPFAYRTEYDPRLRRDVAYLAWRCRPQPGQTPTCEVYFDTQAAGVRAPAFDTTDLPEENLVPNAGFEQIEGSRPAGWEVTSPALVSVGKWDKGAGERSLRVVVDENTPEDADRTVYIRRMVDVSRYAGQEVAFGCDLLAERAAYGVPVTIRLEQFRADGSRIGWYVIQPRWLTVELAQGQLVQIRERGVISPETASVNVVIAMRCYVNDFDTGKRVTGPESYFTVWVDGLTLRPGQRWPWPALSWAGFVPGALESAPVNRAFEFTGQRRLAFNGLSETSLTTGADGPASTVHWGLERGTLELWLRPLWDAEDGTEHTLFYGMAYGHRMQSALRKRGADGRNALEFVILDSGGTRRTVSGPAPLRAGTWTHIAATWDFPTAHLQLYADGRLIGSAGPGKTPWPSSLQHTVEGMAPGPGTSETDTRTMPMQAIIGGDSSWSESGSARAAIDEFRVSDAVRYASDFTPSRQEFAVDGATRALFHFEADGHGVHAADDGFVRGYLGCEIPPQQELATLEVRDEEAISQRIVTVKPQAPEALFEANRAETRMTVTRPVEALPDPRFIELRPCSAERVVSGNNEEFWLSVAGDLPPLMTAITFAHADGDAAQATLLPHWRANDNVVPFSVQSLAETLAPDARDDAEKAFEVFRYALQVTNYYDAHFCETLPARHRDRISYTLLQQLNIYSFDQCGPLNYMLRKLLLAAGISSNDAPGTHHQFEQAFYDGSLRLMDLSPRLYWLNRDNVSRLSLRGLEEDPYLKLRQGGDVNSWLPGRRGQASWGTAERPHSMDFTLRPGERASVSWHNEGRWFELAENRQPIRLERIPPYFGNGAVVCDLARINGAAELGNVSAAQTADGGRLALVAADQAGVIVYKARCPYIYSAGMLTGEFMATAPGDVTVAVSFDEGTSWKQVWSSPTASGRLEVDLGREIMARYAYWLRLDLRAGSGARLQGPQVRSVFVVSPLSLPGKLRLGDNRIRFVAGPVTSPIRTECRWLERHKSDLGIGLDSLSYYHNSGEAHRNLFVVRPGEVCPVRVSLEGRKATGEVSVEPRSRRVVVSDPQAVTPEKQSADFAVSIPDAAEGSIEAMDVVLREGDRQRRVTAQVLVADVALATEAEAAREITGAATVAPLAELSAGRGVQFTGPGEMRFDVKAPKSGEYALWLRARWEPGSRTTMTLALDGAQARELRAEAMIGFSDWTSPARAHTKMFAHFGEQYGHWSWYRVGGVRLDAGAHTLALSAQSGAFFDALILLPATDIMDRAAMNLLQNWNFAPWCEPL